MLTTTSYAILGLIAVRPFSTYELAQQMDRALGHFWPRARSKIYEEPKKLERQGFAKASHEATGRRRRTVYAITPKGRRALAAWVPTPSEGPSLEFEHLIKVFFAEHGSKGDLLTTIRAAKAWSDETTLDTVHVAHAYLDGEGPFPERLPWLVLVGRFLEDFTALVGDWADWAATTVEAWPDELRDAAPDLASLRRAVERADGIAERR